MIPSVSRSTRSTSRRSEVRCLRARALAVAGALLMVIAAWVALPEPVVGGGGDEQARLASAPSPGSPSTLVLPIHQTAPGQLPARIESATAGSLCVQAGVGTPRVGVLLLLRRASFAPRVRFDAELWNAFAAGSRGDLTALCAGIKDRLARVGYECVQEQGWMHGEVLALDATATGDDCTAVAVSAYAIGFARFGVAREVLIQTVGGAELYADGEGELWAWSASDFVGIHPAGAGRLVPAAPGRAVQIVRVPPCRVRYFAPFDASASSRCVLAVAPGFVDRTFADLPPTSTLYLGPTQTEASVDPSQCVVIARAPAVAGWSLREEGNAFGAYLLQGNGGALRAIASVGR